MSYKMKFSHSQITPDNCSPLFDAFVVKQVKFDVDVYEIGTDASISVPFEEIMSLTGSAIEVSRLLTQFNAEFDKYCGAVGILSAADQISNTNRYIYAYLFNHFDSLKYLTHMDFQNMSYTERMEVTVDSAKFGINDTVALIKFMLSIPSVYGIINIETMINSAYTK